MKKTVTLIVVALLSFILMLGYSTSVNSSLSQGIVRLHVLANSDSDSDQALKLKVRDAVLDYSQTNSVNKDDVKNHLDEYKAIAQRVIKENGYSYPAAVEYGNFSFPTKHYENISLPAGSYDAVRIKIGRAEGKNWWCVLFPPLCFVDGTTKTANASEKLRSTLSAKEYDLITAQKSGGRIPVEIKFKIVELCGLLCSRDKVYAKAG